ncbi:MAG: bifunctional aspartate kinase/homoserine dehydrogenase I [Bacteroidales bacterium]|nr:bifunctional aspartate kinase/homoserine dehydrogenase I [Bacteroidales bacterium]
MKVLKFGGSSVGSPERIKKVKQITGANKTPLVIVVSAFQGITDQLEIVSALAATKNIAYKTILDEITERHNTAIEQLITDSEKTTVLSITRNMLAELRDILEGVFLLNDLTPKIHDRILGFGEILSATIISRFLGGDCFIDSRELIKTNSGFGKARVDYQATNENIARKLSALRGICVVPGFIASDEHGNTTTLGRGGSDFSAAIMAAALNASVLEIWTDVDGFMTADPKKVKKAFAIESLSYAEAMELSHFGAKVIYTPTIQPALIKKIPIFIKNTFNPEAQGTKIIEKSEAHIGGSPIKGVSSIDDIDLITLQGPGMVGVKGISSRLFGALAKAGVNIILITQASSEHSITFAISPTDTQQALCSIEKAFEAEINLHEEINIVVEKDLSVIAIVGEQMKNTPGISATLFSSLGRNGISAIATAQGSSELNISVVIRKSSLKKALNVIHEGFFLSHYKELHVYIVGAGTVGSSLLSQVKKQQQHLLDEHNVKVNIVGISRSKKMVIDPDGIGLDDYKNSIENGKQANLDEFIASIHSLNLRNSVFVDCTADEKVASYYKTVLNAYASVVTANKFACSSEYELYKDLKKTALKNNVKFMYETNVGAGLPIINTINDLSRSGDKILKLEAVLSGTLNFILNTVNEDIPLSLAIKMAKDKGFSEPDPRIDLSGIDVLRKLVILAREAGYPIEQTNVETEPFLPAAFFEGPLDNFWKKIPEYDKEFESRRKEIAAKGLRWRFIASLDHGKAKTGLQAVDIMHPAYPLEGSNNIILITTERYNDAPMVIRGYGAGADVTAAGVFADIIRVANV